MQISSTSTSPVSRTVTPSKSSSDRQSNDEAQQAIVENKAQEQAQQQRAIQENLQQKREDDQRRLDGRLISFGPEENPVNNEQKKASLNRSRVNEAYSAPKNELSHSHNQHARPSQQSDNDTIDVVV